MRVGAGEGVWGKSIATGLSTSNKIDNNNKMIRLIYIINSKLLLSSEMLNNSKCT